MRQVGQFFRRVWRLTAPYYQRSEERWRARRLLAVNVSLSRYHDTRVELRPGDAQQASGVVVVQPA